MLAKILGFLLLLIGGAVALGLVVALIGTLIGLVWFVAKLAIPVLLVYLGYRLLTRDRQRVVYY